jgi:hypothetical protein
MEEDLTQGQIVVVFVTSVQQYKHPIARHCAQMETYQAYMKALHHPVLQMQIMAQTSFISKALKTFKRVKTKK